MKIKAQDGRIVWFFFRPYKLQCLGVLALMFLSGMMETLNLASLYPIINYGLKLQKKDAFLQVFEKAARQIAPDNFFLAACVLLMVISVLAIATKFFYTFSSSKLLTRIIGDTQKKIFDKFIAAVRRGREREHGPGDHQDGLHRARRCACARGGGVGGQGRHLVHQSPARNALIPGRGPERTTRRTLRRRGSRPDRDPPEAGG